MPDLQAAALAPHLLARLAREAPSLDLDIVAPGANEIEALEHDDADAMVALIDEAPAGIRRRRLYDEKLVTLMSRTDHPAAVGEPAFSLWRLSISWSASPASGLRPSMRCSRSWARRRVKLRVPNFFAAVEIAARSGVMTLPSSLARSAADMRRFVSRPPPLDLGSFTMSLAWHARQQERLQGTSG